MADVVSISGPARQTPLLPSAILGTAVFVATEVMFFFALISAFLVVKASSGTWAPPANVTLPVLATAFNSAVLIASAVFMHISLRRFKPGQTQSARPYYGLAAAFGLFFVVFQGIEWVQLVSFGMTMTSGVFGATFFLIIGSHGLHALVASLMIGWYWLKMRENQVRIDQLRALQIFWYFVVGMWPILYTLVYFP